jgi:hypothetical protein
MQSLQESTGQAPSTSSALVCAICGCQMYATDYGNSEITYHCGSPEARFWDFDRGTTGQAKAKQHWDQSIREVFLNRG